MKRNMKAVECSMLTAVSTYNNDMRLGLSEKKSMAGSQLGRDVASKGYRTDAQ